MFNTLLKHTRLILLWAFLFAFIAVGISLFLPQQYSTASRLLIITRSAGSDPYTQAKSAERIGENLAEIVKTADFYKKVSESSVAFDKTRWAKLAERERRIEWGRDVKAEMIYNTSLLTVTVYGPTPDEAINFSKAVNDILTTRSWEYIGNDVVLKEVDSPLVSRFFTRPNLPVNAAAGFLIGLLLASLYVLKYKHSWLD